MSAVIGWGGMPWQMLGLLMAIALVVSSIGFYRMVYFISIGYAFSIAAMVVALVIVAWEQLSWLALAQNALLLVWGLRLGASVVRASGGSRASAGQSMHGASAGLNFGVRSAIWVTVALLYVALLRPASLPGLGARRCRCGRAVQALGGAAYGGRPAA